MDLPKFVGERIKYFRKQANLTQEELAKFLGTTKATISNYETGYRSPQQDTLFSLSEALNISIDDLFPTDIKTKNIVTIYNELNIDNQKMVYEFAEDRLKQQKVHNNKIISIGEVKELYQQYQIEDEEVDVYGVVSAGTGVEVFEEVIETVKCPSPVPDHDIALKVFGDSMYPLFQHEQIIFVNRTTEIRHGQIGVFMVNGQAFLKKLYKDYSSVKLISLNKDYDDIELTEFDRVDVVGTVIL